MADKNQIKNAIVLEGEAEYKKSIDSINRALRESKSAMKAAAAEYDSAGDSMVAMYREGDALERHLRNQEEALRLMGEQLGKVESAYGRNSREATELRTRINNMRAEMARTTGELRDFETRMEQAAKAMDDADAGKAGDALEQLGRNAEKADGQAGGLLETLTKMTGLDLSQMSIAGIGAAAAGVAKTGIETADEQTAARGQMAAYTGKTGEELAELEEVSKDVFRQGYGEDLMDASQGVATLHAYTKTTGEELQGATQIAFRMRDVFGHDIPESARTAQQMMSVFGISVKDAYALMAAGAQNGADKNGNLLDTINEYALYYEKAGKSAEEFMGSLTAGSENGIYDVDKIGDAMKEFTIRMADGSETTKEGLKTLGVEAMDLPGKFAQGGETASAAFDLIIDKLLAVEDPLTRNQTGIALFGTQWEDTGGAILEIFDQIDSGATDARAALDALDAERLNDLGEAGERISRHVSTALGEMFTPLTTGMANELHGFADVLDEAEKKADAAQQRAKEASDAMLDATAEKQAKVLELEEQITQAYANGDYYEALTLSAQKQKLIDEIGETKQEVLAGYEEIGTQAAQTMEAAAPDMLAAAETVTGEAVGAIEDAQQDMRTEGETLGEEAVIGLEGGMEDLGRASEDAVAGAIGVLERSVSRSYRAGRELGSAFVRGYKTEMQIHSPSRVMQKAAKDTTQPLFDRFEEDEIRLQEAGAALGAALSSGYDTDTGGGYGTAYGGANGMGGASKEVIAAAMREALTGLAWETDVGTFARLVEPGVSVASSQRAQATVKGQSAMTKRW